MADSQSSGLFQDAFIMIAVGTSHTPQIVLQTAPTQGEDALWTGQPHGKTVDLPVGQVEHHLEALDGLNLPEYCLPQAPQYHSAPGNTHWQIDEGHGNGQIDRRKHPQVIAPPPVSYKIGVQLSGVVIQHVVSRLIVCLRSFNKGEKVPLQVGVISGQKIPGFRQAVCLTFYAQLIVHRSSTPHIFGGALPADNG